jgi:hypothetical protein
MFYTLLFLLGAFANPFEIEIETKKEPLQEDYEALERALKEISVAPLILQNYPMNWDIGNWFTKREPYSVQDFILRCSKGLMQHFFVDEYNCYPKIVHQKGEQKRDCIVFFCSYDGPYPHILPELVGALREVGFDGGIYYRIGGYPNPTGDELRYAGVPYAFKVFAIQEALMMGYENVLWLDTSAWPLAGVEDIFQEIATEGFYFDSGKSNPLGLLPLAKKELDAYLGRSIASERKVAGWIMGISNQDPRTKKILEDYKSLVRLGIPFLSVNPEEYVLTAVLLKNGVDLKERKNLMVSCKKDYKGYVDAKKMGCKFIIRAH